jgi:membrane protein
MLEKIQHTKQFAQFRLLLKRYHLENAANTIYRILEVLITKILQFDIDVRAAAVAYNFTLAIFPTIIFLFSLIPYIPVENLDLKIIALLSEVLPKGIFHEAQETIIEIVSKPRGGVLSLGFIFALYASTSGMMALMRAFNITYKTSEQRGFIKARLIAVMLNFLLTFVLVVAIGFLIVGRLLVDFLFDEGVFNRDFTFYALQLLTYLVIFLVFFVTISIIYYWAPAIHKKWNFINAGSVTASILTILVSNLFSFYLANFASYNRLYGAIGTFIALMVWLYLIALILILGFEINASIAEALYVKSESKIDNGDTL